MMDPNIALMKNRGPKACTTCAKAKARCIPGPEGSLKCDRCDRLSKPCVSQTPAPPRARKGPKLSKIAALEKRLEQLSSKVQDGSSQSSSPPTKEEPRSESCGDRWDFVHIFPLRHAVPEAAPKPAIVEAQSPSPTKVQPWDSWWPNEDEAEMLLEIFKAAHLPLFPFVLVPDGVSSLELQRTHPFLWKSAIMVGCFVDGARQLKLGKEVLEQISQAAIVEADKSVDILEGLLILVAMFHYALKGSQVTNLLFLARAMCVNLAFKNDVFLQGEERDRNLNCMRAYAGTYYLNTLVFTANKRPDALMNTGLLETCCNVLESTMQYPSDEYLVKLVRIQQLAQSISLTIDIGNLNSQAMKLPLTMVVRSFQDQLDQFSNSLPPHLADNDALKSHVNIAEILLYQIAIPDQQSNASYLPLTDRLQLLWGCLRSLRSFCAIRFAHQDFERPRFLCLSSSDFVFAIITGLKLMTLQLSGWNLDQIQSEVDLIDVMDRQSRDLITIVTRRREGFFPGKAPSMPRPEDPFEKLLCHLKILRDMVKVELERQAAGRANTPRVGINQDLFSGNMEEDFWQSMGAVDLWNVVGDPSVLDPSTS